MGVVDFYWDLEGEYVLGITFFLYFLLFHEWFMMVVVVFFLLCLYL